MLVLIDRGFDGGEFLAEVAATGAQFLVRLHANRRPPVLARCPTALSCRVIGGMKVRIIAAQITVTCHDGTRYGGSYRLATTLLDHRAYPARALISLYHERWEHEVAYLALRHTLLQGRVLRSGDPVGLQQEMWALLALYQALRSAITAPSNPAPAPTPTGPATIALKAAQNLVTTPATSSPTTTSTSSVTSAGCPGDLHPPRRPRASARKVKSPLSRWNKHPPGKPRTSQRITSITTRSSASTRHEHATRRRHP